MVSLVNLVQGWHLGFWSVCELFSLASVHTCCALFCDCRILFLNGNGFLWVYFRATHNTAGSDLLPSHAYRCQHVAWSTGTQVSATFISLCACEAKNVHTCTSIWLVVGMIVETSMKLVDAVLLTCLQIMVVQVSSYMCVSGWCRRKSHWLPFECWVCVLSLNTEVKAHWWTAFMSVYWVLSLSTWDKNHKVCLMWHLFLENSIIHCFLCSGIQALIPIACISSHKPQPLCTVQYSTVHRGWGLWLLMHANWCVCVFSSLCSPTLIPSYAQEHPYLWWANR